MYSVLAVRRNIPKAEAIAIVDKVFPKCYADLEPIGLFSFAVLETF